MMNWNYIKDFQIYFVEYNNQILKYNGFDALEDFVKSLQVGEKFVVYMTQCYSECEKKERTKDE